ncbi:hypothetical protein PUNSTDRAFT_26986, partial [Punctularia strigosozonata HHB-11173 SS5]|uniref:uncharacterized protein n=1 Tax=Punctularia strigosozonata (strain HHB-11173) TaxID=741275 RepID=UPI000441808C
WDYVYDRLRLYDQEMIKGYSQDIDNLLIFVPAPASVEPLNMSFQADSHVVAINTLWFLSLILALASALLGIFVKQWLREYMAWPNISPVQHAIQLREFRYDAFQNWKVPTIV